MLDSAALSLLSSQSSRLSLGLLYRGLHGLSISRRLRNDHRFIHHRLSALASRGCQLGTTLLTFAVERGDWRGPRAIRATMLSPSIRTVYNTLSVLESSESVWIASKQTARSTYKKLTGAALSAWGGENGGDLLSSTTHVELYRHV